MALSPERADQVYNFTCDGCAKRRVRRGSRMVEGKIYCARCLAVFEEKEPGWLRRSLGQSLERYEASFKPGSKPAPSFNEMRAQAMRNVDRKRWRP